MSVTSSSCRPSSNHLMSPSEVRRPASSRTTANVLPDQARRRRASVKTVCPAPSATRPETRAQTPATRAVTSSSSRRPSKPPGSVKDVQRDLIRKWNEEPQTYSAPKPVRTRSTTPGTSQNLTATPDPDGSAARTSFHLFLLRPRQPPPRPHRSRARSPPTRAGERANHTTASATDPTNTKEPDRFFQRSSESHSACSTSIITQQDHTPAPNHRKSGPV
jgi:hypothetical protein